MAAIAREAIWEAADRRNYATTSLSVHPNLLNCEIPSAVLLRHPAK